MNLQPAVAAHPVSDRPAAERVRQFAVEGMSCASCVGRVERAIAKVPGVRSVSVNLATERADVSFSGDPDVAGVVRAIEDTGYSAKTDETELSIEGMSCASCVGRIERALKAVLGLVVRQGFEDDDVLRLVAAVESRSEHPIGEAIVSAAGRRGLKLDAVSGFEATPGFGISGMVAGRSVELGADRFMEQLGHDPSEFASAARRLGGFSDWLRARSPGTRFRASGPR